MNWIQLDAALVGDPEWVQWSSGESILTFTGPAADYVAGVVSAAVEARIQLEREEALNKLISEYAARLALTANSQTSLHVALTEFVEHVRELTKAESR